MRRGQGHKREEESERSWTASKGEDGKVRWQRKGESWQTMWQTKRRSLCLSLSLSLFLSSAPNPPSFPVLRPHLQESPLCLSDTVSAHSVGRPPFTLFLPLLLSLYIYISLSLSTSHSSVPIAPSPWWRVIVAILPTGRPCCREKAGTGGRVPTAWWIDGETLLKHVDVVKSWKWLISLCISTEWDCKFVLIVCDEKTVPKICSQI